MRNFYKKIEEITVKDKRYKPDAYEFVMRALWFTQKRLKKQGHISGKELLHGIKDFVLDQYGPMSKAVLQFWGIGSTDDFGEIVFNMVESGLLNKTDADSREDFKNVYNFNEVFDIFKNHSFEKLTTSSKQRPFHQKAKFSAIKPSIYKNNLDGNNLN